MAKKITTYKSTIGLKPIYSTKDPEGNPATLGEPAAKIFRENFGILEDILSALRGSRMLYAGTANLVLIPIAKGEKRIIYAEGDMLSKLEVKPYHDPLSNWVEIPLDQDINIDVSAYGKTLLLRMTSTQDDGMKTMILTKAK